MAWAAVCERECCARCSAEPDCHGFTLFLDVAEPYCLLSDDDGEPEVTHGHTLCSKVKLIEVIIALQRYAFVNSQLPVQMSLEMHCSQ